MVVDKTMFGNRLKKTILIVLTVAIFLLGTSIYLRVYLNNTIKEAIINQIKVDSDEYIDRLKEQVDTDFQILNSFASIFTIENDLDIALALDLANQKSDFILLGYFSSSSNVVAINDQDIKYDVKTSNLSKPIQSVIEETLLGKKAISDIFESELSTQPTVAYGIPVLRNNQIIGSLVALDVLHITTDENDNTYACIIDSDGNILLGSNQDINQTNSFFENINLKDTNINQIKSDLKNNKNVSLTFDYKDESCQAILKPIDINDWYMVCIDIDQSAGLSISQTARIVNGLFVVIVILVIGLLLYGYWMTLKNNHELALSAYYDRLTGAYNLLYFNQKGKQELRQNLNCSIVVLNIRQFKFFNEIFGNEQGDKLLCHIKGVIENNLNSEEFCCRDTADQFFLFLRDIDKEIIESRLNKIIEEIFDYDALLHTNYHLKIHCGIVISSDQYNLDTTFDGLMVSVMFALDKAKEKLQTSIWFYDVELHEREKIDNYIESHMHQALEKHEFKFFLQPKIGLKDGSLESAEALVRWITNDGQELYPDQFIPIFEKSGFCIELDMYMFEEACKQIKEWIDEGIEPIGISVNQSKLLFYEADYVERLEKIINKYQIPANLITLEILENLVIDNVDEVNSKIECLHKIGFRVSMDDFGSGYSSLNILGKLDIDELKIDKDFLQEIFVENNFRTKLIMEEIVKLAKILSISTVVEGVETLECNYLIRSFGCDFGQGYYYDKPISNDKFNLRYMKNRKKIK